MKKIEQITALQERINALKGSNTVTLLDEFLIKVWERSIELLNKP